MSSIDTDINNYTISELLTILDVDDNLEEIQTKTNEYIQKFIKQGNTKMATFFQDMQQRLLNYSTEGDETDQNIEDQTKNWIENENLQQSDSTQANKNTKRKDQIDVYQNDHVPMNQNQLGVNNNFNVPVAQDSLNPTLKNITERFINLDSQFRQAGMSSTDYTLDLSDHLKDVLTLRLYSFQIPVTWYVIDTEYGNTCFWIQNGLNNVVISIISGNYNITNFISTLNSTIISSGFTGPTTTPVTYNDINAKVTINLYGFNYSGNDSVTGLPINFTITEQTQIIFYDYTAKLQCNTKCVNKTFYINQTLGWIMGYRSPIINISQNGNVSNSVLDLIGPRYFILLIDDLNQNHLNNGLVSITELSKQLKLPSYYSPDLPYICVQGSNNATSPTPISNNSISFDKFNVNYSSYEQLVPSAPRTLTQSQIYTINEIIKNNDKTTNYRAKAPTNSNVFALIPIKGSQNLGSLYADFSGSLQDFKRIYFGPVDIDRLKITLLDDKGNVVNLNGAEWSITLISENLYQY